MKRQWHRRIKRHPSQGIGVPLPTRMMQFEVTVEIDIVERKKINLSCCNTGELGGPSQRVLSKIECPYYMVPDLADEVYAASFNRILSVPLNVPCNNIFFVPRTDKILNVSCHFWLNKKG